MRELASDLALPLARAARERPAHPALIHAGRSVDYRELESRARELAARLAGLGLAAGERLALLLGNDPLHVALVHAALGLGSPLVPLNTRLTARELAPLIEDARPALLICGDAFEAAAREAARGRATRLVPARELLGAPRGEPRWLEQLDPEADQAILFTSGTTGRPKGVRLSMANQWASARASAERLGLAADDRWLACMPLYHVGGLAIALRSALAATTLVLHERFDAEPVRGALERERITQVSFVSTMLARLLDTGGAAPSAPQLRCALLGGGPIAPALIERARRAGYPLAATYGLTEAASQVATCAPGDDPASGLPPLPHTELRIVSEGGRTLPDGAGEILVRGPQVMRGYLDRPQDSARALRDGWLHTGDFGRLDASGRLHVLERRSDLIVSGGENVYPSEVEAVLLEHPAVREAGVIGRSDPEWGQRVEAVLVCDATERAEGLRAALLAHCARRLAGFKRPRALHFAEELPRTASGKLRRDALRRALDATAGG